MNFSALLHLISQSHENKIVERIFEAEKTTLV